MEQQEINLDLKDLFYLLLKWWWVPAIFVVIFPVAAYFYTNYTYVPQYTAHATMLVSSKQVRIIGGQVEVANDVGLSQKLVNTYSVILKSDRVMEMVAEDLGVAVPPSELRRHVVVAPANKNTEVLVVQVRNTDPRLAANICNSIMKVAPQAIAGTVEVGSVNVVDYARVPGYPMPPLTSRNMSVGALLGLMLGVGLVFLVRFFDNTIKNGDDLRAKLGLAFLGGIPFVRKPNKTTALIIGAASGQPFRTGFGYVEAYKALRTNLRYVTQVKDSKKLLLAGALHSEGKSTTSVNLAIALAQSGRTVLLIDCDLRSPGIHKMFDLQIEKDNVLDRVLSGRVKAEDAIVFMEETGISLLPAGGAFMIRPNCWDRNEWRSSWLRWRRITTIS
jgi:succinoglycan biosynthesis transport protein ExoP